MSECVRACVRACVCVCCLYFVFISCCCCWIAFAILLSTRCFQVPQVHCIVLSTPWFQVAPGSQCYVANSVHSSRPRFTMLCCQLRAFKSPQVHNVMLPTPCFQVAPFSLIQWLLSLEFNVGPVTKEMVEQAVKSKSVKAPGPDNIPPEHLKAGVVVTADSNCMCCQTVCVRVCVCVWRGGWVLWWWFTAIVVLLPTACFQGPQRSCCQLRAFMSPQVHNVMLPTPCFQVAPSSKCYVANSVLSSPPSSPCRVANFR